MARVEATTHRIGRWRTSDQNQRWCAATPLHIEQRFRCVKGVTYLPLLKAALGPNVFVQIAAAKAAPFRHSPEFQRTSGHPPSRAGGHAGARPPYSTGRPSRHILNGYSIAPDRISHHQYVEFVTAALPQCEPFLPLLMAITTKAANAYKLFKSGKSAYAYYKLAKGALDEDTRNGSLFKLGVKVAGMAASKVIGSSITSHPYFTYHKVHFELLADALNASSQKGYAADAFKRAVMAADSTADVTITLEAMTHRRGKLFLYYWLALGGTVDLRNRARSGGAAAAEMKSAGYSAESLDAGIAASLEEWRAQWAELTRDAFDLLIMVEAEARLAEEAMQRYNTKIDQLTSGSDLQRIAGYAEKRDRDFAILDRERQRGSSQAVSDPAKYARRQCSIVDDAASRYAQALDIVMSDGVYTSDTMIKQLDGIFMSK